MSTLDLYALSVHPAAEVFPMLPETDLAALAADIVEHGLRQPVAVARIDGTKTLIDGRNRLAACRLAGVDPTWVELPADTDLVGYIISANIARRHMTKGQQAMAVAMVYPKAEKGGRGRNSLVSKEFSEAFLSQARFVLANDPASAARVLSGDQGLYDAYETTRARSAPPSRPDADVETERRRAREWKEQWRAERDAKRAAEADLAALAADKKVEVIERVVEPPDYTEAKARALDLERQIDQQRKSRAHDVRVEVERHRLAQRRADEEAERKAAAAQQMMATAQEAMGKVRAVTGAHNRVIQSLIAAGRRLDDALAALVEHPTPPSDESRYAAATLATRARLLADRLDGWRGNDTLLLLDLEPEPETPHE